MVLAEIFLILLVALLLAWIVAIPLGRPGWEGGFWWLFLVLFLGTWAIAAWTGPVGPAVWGVAWVPILVAAVLIMLLLLAVPPRRPVSVEMVEEDAMAKADAAVVGAFFWFLLLGLVLVIGISFMVAT